MASEQRPFDVKLTFGARADDLNDLKNRLLASMSPMDILSTLCEGLYHKREQDPENFSAADGQRWQELLDLMDYVEGPDEEASHPANDPVTLINRQISEGLVDEKAGQALKAEFMKAVRQATGKRLTEDHVAGLYQLFTGFNPAKLLTPAKPDHPAP